jgi:hypothetical protein
MRRARRPRPDWISLGAAALALYGAFEVARWRGTELWWVSFVGLLHVGIGGVLLSFVDRREADRILRALTGLRRTESRGIEIDPEAVTETRRVLARLVPAALTMIAVVASPLGLFELADRLRGKPLGDGSFPLGILALATVVPLMRWAKRRQG